MTILSQRVQCLMLQSCHIALELEWTPVASNPEDAPYRGKYSRYSPKYCLHVLVTPCLLLTVNKTPSPAENGNDGEDGS
jgi:hypothetical protein